MRVSNYSCPGESQMLRWPGYGNSGGRGTSPCQYLSSFTGHMQLRHEEVGERKEKETFLAEGPSY